MNVLKTNNTKDKVRQLQRKLYQSAKRNSVRRFHAVFDKVYRKDILIQAWKQVKSNKGSAGIDEQTIFDVECYGVEKLILEIQKELKEGNYEPPIIRRAYIPKRNGKERPLGIPTVRDRVIQTAAKIVLEPIFDADFKDNSYGFRPKRNQHQALEVIKKACNNKGNYVLDADIKGYFENINHNKLLMLIEKRICDRRMIKLIKKWLKVGVVENGVVTPSEAGCPQGSAISPLFSNIYLDYLDTKWERHYSHLGKLVRYADDFVIICKNYKNVQHSFQIIKLIMERLELELNLEKTEIINLWGGQEGFVFLGYQHRKVEKKRYNGQKYYTTERWICKKAYERIKGVIKQTLNNATTYLQLEQVIKTLNLKIVGWRNYYCLSPIRILLKMDKYIRMRLIYWYNRKRQTRKRKEFNKLKKHFYDLGLKRVAFTS